MHVIQKNYLILLMLILGASLATQAADHRVQLSQDDQKLLGRTAAFYKDALKNPEKNFEPFYNICKEEDRLEIAVYCATKNGHIKLIEQFLKKAPIQKMRLGNRSTPLHVAAKHNHADIVATLLAAKAKPHLTTKDGANPLRTAVECNSLEAARKLLDADKANANYGPVRTAIPADNSTALHVAAQQGNEKMSKLLVLFNADVDAKTLIGQTPLLTAAQMGHENLAKYLVNVKADPNAVTTTGISTLRFAVQKKYAIIVKALLDEKLEVQADPNVQLEQDQSTCMHVVAEQGDTETAQLLLAAKADINALMDGGNTPLHLAARKNVPHMISFLLKNGATPTIANDIGFLPHLLVLYNGGDDQMIEILEAMPTFLTPENPAHPYILHDIADAMMRLDSDADASLIHRCQQLIKTFIEKGIANPDNVDPSGNTYLDILNGTSESDSEPQAEEKHKAPEPQPEQKQKTAKPSRTPSPENLALAVQLEQASRQARNKEEQQRIAEEQAIIEHKRVQRAKEAKAKAGKKQTVAIIKTKQLLKQEKPQQEQKQESVTPVAKKTRFTPAERKKFKQAQALLKQQAKERTKREEVINDMLERIDKEKVEDYEAEQAQQVELFQALAGDLWNQDLGDWEQEQFWLQQNAATQDDGGPAL